MKILNEDSGEELKFDVEIQASKIEILNAIVMLSGLIGKDELPNEAIFVNTETVQIVRVSKLD